MTEVRVRHQWEPEAKAKLFDVPYDKLDDALPLVRAWGMYSDGNSGMVDGDDLVAQFVYCGGGVAYFEVIICDD